MKPTLVFFGTGPVSLHCLEGIYPHFEIEAIITKPDRKSPSGTSHPHPVRAWAQDHGVKVFQVDGEDDLKALWHRQQFSSPAGLVVDFGMTIPPSVIESFERGILNSHFSLLPLLRGADPISFAILEGHAQTGVSLMRIVPKMDEGDLLCQQTYPLPKGITTPELTASLSEMSNQMLIRDLPPYIEGTTSLHPQDPTIPATYSRKLTKQDGVIDWSKPAIALEREVRAFTPWPGSRSRLYAHEVTITATHTMVGQDWVDKKLQAGTVITSPEIPLMVATGKGGLVIDQLKPAGKREMSGAEFVRGYSKA